MIYEFKCEKCEAIKTISVPLSEYYIPDCDNCSNPMKRKYTKPIIASGALNRGNIPND